MTHDELLERVNEYISSECDCESCQYINGPYKALRAVVELHKPFTPMSVERVLCMDCSLGTQYEVEYPCLTIQAIEEQIK